MYEPGDLDPVSQRVKPTTHIKVPGIGTKNDMCVYVYVWAHTSTHFCPIRYTEKSCGEHFRKRQNKRHNMLFHAK